MTIEPSWYFTAPWDPVAIRRGDALGFRASADYFADLLAPGLSNATSDARWISLLSWCLKWSHVTWTKADGGDLSQRDGQRARYAWLRPLELLWVDRALEFGQGTGQLRGRRSVKRWRDSGCEAPNFAMSPDQFRRYRQVGMYGAYRIVLRSMPGLTTGDGWTPGKVGLELAQQVNESLPKIVRLEQKQFENGTQWGSWSGGKEARYWIERGWSASTSKTGGLLPTPDSAVSKRLPELERRLLEPALFDPGSIRRITVEILAGGASAAKSHADLCDILANSELLATKLDPASIAPLPAFSRFADAAMHAMRGLWTDVNNSQTRQAPAIEELARSAESRLDMARKAGAVWLRAPGRNVFPHDGVVTKLAKAMQEVPNPIGQLRALERHHREYGGGQRWFSVQGETIVPLVRDKNSIAASDYRFRLRTLGRLAAQCGIAKMKHVLEAVDKNEFDAVTEHEPEDEEGDVL
jgi:hypothetical protein